MTRPLWIVTNQWQGNTNEGVLVEADDEAEALVAAKAALVEHWTSDLASETGFIRKEAREHIDSYTDPDLKWWFERVTLPHVGEF